MCMCLHAYVCIYVYIYIYTEYAHELDIKHTNRIKHRHYHYDSLLIVTLMFTIPFVLYEASYTCAGLPRSEVAARPVAVLAVVVPLEVDHELPTKPLEEV